MISRTAAVMNYSVLNYRNHFVIEPILRLYFLSKIMLRGSANYQSLCSWVKPHPLGTPVLRFSDW